MRHTPLESGSRIDRLGMVGGPLLVIALMGVLSGWTGAGRGHAGLEAAWVLLRALPWALGWLVAAIGFGWPLRRLLAGDGRAGFAIQVGLGVAGLLILDAALGALGVLQIGGSLGAWVLLVAGLALAAEQARRWYTGGDRPLPYVPWPVWTAAPAVAVLLIAACSAPGWLWASEFGGYDALSYHLQLPKEWLAAGRIEPLEHNVYSFLPGYVEAAYYHLAVLIGDGVEAVYACQVLHGGFTLLTAALVGGAAARHGGRVAGSVAAVIVVGTPWVVVVGSLAYNEMVVALLLAAGLLVVEETGLSPGRRGAAVGLIAAAACGSKLTAVGFVAVPLGLLLLGLSHPRRWLWIAACAGVAGLVGLLPYLLRNWAYAGNPVFPFAGEWLGLAHWVPEQAEAWTRSHLPGASFGARLEALWNEILRYGLGSSPDPAEPWRPQWSLLPWLALGGFVVAVRTGHRRSWAVRLIVVGGVQVLFWLLLTHLKSRFLLPAVVPAALLVGAAAGVVTKGPFPVARPVLVVAAVIAALAWSCLPAAIFLRERGSAPSQMVGWADVVTGDRLTVADRRALAETSPVVYLNHLAAPGSRTLMIGEARPLYYHGRVAYQTTWDRGPLSRAMRRLGEHPSAWLDALREEGFTHLLVNNEMLARWADEEWNDPLLTTARVRAAAESAQIERQWPGGFVLYRLE